MNEAVYIVGAIALAAIIALAMTARECGRLMRERSERDGKLIDRLGDKVSANSELQVERIKIESQAALAAIDAAKTYRNEVARNNGFYPAPVDGEEEVSVPSRA